MPDVTITIGGRDFDVACQEGEEHFLRAAARMLDTEAQILLDQIGRLPEARMLLMAGLMLADRAAGTEDELRAAHERIAALEADLSQQRARPAPPPERVEVSVIPADLTESLAELAARSEAYADAVEDRCARIDAQLAGATGRGPGAGPG